MKTEKMAYAVISTIIAAVFSVFLLLYDVAAAGPAGSRVGLSHINYAVYNVLGSNDQFYYLSTIIGCAAVGVALIFAVLGIIKQIKNRTIDKSVAAIYGLYIAVAALFLALDRIALNFGPTIMPGNLFATASFSAPWMLMTIVVCASIMMTVGRLVTSKMLIIMTRLVLVIMVVSIITCSVLSGEYWITDVVDGILVSNAIMGWFAFVVADRKIDKSPQYNIAEIERKLFANQKTQLSTKLGPKGPQS